MNKLYALLLLTWLFAGCATTSQVSAPPADVYIAVNNAPCYLSPSLNDSPTGSLFTQNQQVHVLRHEKPNWVVVSYEGREVFIPEGFTSTTKVEASSFVSTPSTPPTYLAPPTPTPSTGASGNRTIYTGPRGGKYYINGNGNKTYIKRK